MLQRRQKNVVLPNSLNYMNLIDTVARATQMICIHPIGKHFSDSREELSK